jgi:F-type H+-transporting ATPase subunit a
MENPLQQFAVKPIISIFVNKVDLSLTNSALAMICTAAGIILFFFLGTFKKKLIPSRMQSLVEITVEFIDQMIEENIGQEGKKFLPFVLSLFLFILFGNMLGMLPIAFTFTSQIILTFSLAAFVFLLVTIVGFFKHGTKFFSFFLPEGAPLLLAPILVPIELISYLSRPISLSIRLFANMMAGHTMMKVFAFFTVALGAWGISTIIVNAALIGFEFLVAFLQAYVFSVLTCLYIKDALYLH